MRKPSLVFLQLMVVLISGLAFAMTSSGSAAETEWSKAQNSRFRLIAASGVPDAAEGMLVAGVEIELADGWKTYWRSPGDGLATEIDMSASENVAEAHIFWPVPKRFEGEGGTTSYGYKGAVILPILLKASNPDRQAALRVTLIYGVCADICIPVEGTAELSIRPGNDNQHAAALANALAQVPVKQAEGINCSHRFAKARLETDGSTPVLLIETAFDGGVTGRDLFVERENGLSLPPAELQGEPGSGKSVYAIRLDQPGIAEAIRNERLILTMTSDQGSCETSWYER